MDADRSINSPGAPGSNTGHGHVFPRPDGARARCGGPALCGSCQADAARKTGAAATSARDGDEITEDAAMLAARHPAVAGVARFLLDVNPNLPPALLRIAREFRLLTRWLLDTLDDGPETTAALRKVLEAKDCAVRAALPAGP